MDDSVWHITSLVRAVLCTASWDSSDRSFLTGSQFSDRATCGRPRCLCSMPGMGKRCFSSSDIPDQL